MSQNKVISDLRSNLLKCNGIEELVKLAFYEAFKSTNQMFNGEIPFIEKEHFENVSCGDQIDEDPTVKAEYELFLKKIKMKSKYGGIDSRDIKCCDTSHLTNEAGISFDSDDGKEILRFHFLEYVKPKGEHAFLTQTTKSMHLDKNNVDQLIEALQEIKSSLKSEKDE